MVVFRIFFFEFGIFIVVLVLLVECMVILLEGGWKCFGDMFFVLLKFWIIFSLSDLDLFMNSLFVYKVIFFDKGGRSFIDVFDLFRCVIYFVNFFINVIIGG